MTFKQIKRTTMGQTDDNEEVKLIKSEEASESVTAEPNKHSVFYGHGTAKSKNQRFTLAIVPTSGTTANIGIAVCSSKDVFVKRVGRNIAYGRAMKKPTMSCENVNTTTVEGMLDIKKNLKEEIARNIAYYREVICSVHGH